MVYLKAAEREDQIVASAVTVLSNVGVAAMTLRAVAAEAGVSLGTVQYIFPSKDQLLHAVVLRVIRDVTDALRPETDLDRGVEHALRQGISSFWDKLVDHRVGLQVMQYELLAYSVRSEDHSLARQQYESYTSVVADFCERAAQSAGERCAIGYDVLGRLVLAQVDGLILQYVAKPDTDRARRDLQRALDMVVAYADPRPTARRPARRKALDRSGGR